MTSWVIRAIFLAQVALALSAQSARLEKTGVSEMGATLEQNVRALGLIVRPSDISQTLTVSTPRCAEPLHLTTVQFDGAGSATASYLLTLPGEARFIYLGFVGRTPDPVQIAARWSAGTALRVLGMRESSVPREVLVVIIPPSCPHLEELDWATLSPWG